MAAVLPPSLSVTRQYDLNGGVARCISALNSTNIFRIPGPRNDFLSIPGHGNQARPFCGTVTHAVQCPNKCEKPILHHYSCHNLTCTCESCTGTAVSAKAHRIVRRHKMMGKLLYQNGQAVGTLKHIMLSPDNPPTIEEFLADRGLSFRREAIRHLREHSKDGFFAGTIFCHPFRYDHLDGTACEDPDCKRAHQYTYSPHFHFLGHGFLEKSNEFYKKTDWIYKNIGPGKRRSLYDTAAYELSHVGVFMREKPYLFEGMDTGITRWSVIGTVYFHVGKFSNAAGGGIVESREKVPVECPKCKYQLLEFGVTCVCGKDRNGHDDHDIEVITVDENWVIGVHTVWAVTELWHLNVPTYQYTFDRGQAKIHRGPNQKIFLRETFREDDDGLIISY